MSANITNIWVTQIPDIVLIYFNLLYIESKSNCHCIQVTFQGTFPVTLVTTSSLFSLFPSAFYCYIEPDVGHVRACYSRRLPD